MQTPEDSKLIPEGRIRARRLDHTFGRASTKTKQIGVSLEITADGPFKGNVLTWYGFFTPDTTEETLRGMRALGWEGNDIRAGWPDVATAPDVIAVIKHEDGDNGTYARVRWVNPVGVVMKDKMSDADLALFANEMKGVAARIGGGSSDKSNGNGERSLPDTRRSSPRDDAPPPPSDDDAPPFERGRQRR